MKRAGAHRVVPAEACPLRAREPWPFVEGASIYASDALDPLALTVEIDPAEFAPLRAISSVEEREAATASAIVFAADDDPVDPTADALAEGERNGTMTAR